MLQHGRVLAVVTLALVLTASTQTFGCPLCSTLTPTLTEQIAQADGVCLVRFVQSELAHDQNPGSSTYVVLEVLKTSKDAVKMGDRIKRAPARPAKVGDLFLVLGPKASDGNRIEWGTPTEITEAGFAYVAQAPPPKVSRPKRLKYFVRFLEFPDLLVSNDAYFEFSNAPYQDICAVASFLPKEKLRTWLSQPQTPETRVGLYGLLLGLCGDRDDAMLLADKIAPSTGQFRLGLDGMISGYLLLAGSSGLDKIDDWKFKVHNGKAAAYSDTYAAMAALRFMQDYAGGKISSERLMQSIHLLLDRPELADLAIRDLARWKDWSIQDRLISVYGKDAYNRPGIKAAIIGYMLASAKGKEQPAARAKQFLETLRKREPKVVRAAERFFFN
ncbi:MAG TPA: hypothetical protein VFG04_16595 [Planctomycetaceae bacterium]|jgi:hypothetical protein|nr:hypothetical protein [Planctomycetaceae bacterium]